MGRLLSGPPPDGERRLASGEKLGGRFAPQQYGEHVPRPSDCQASLKSHRSRSRSRVSTRAGTVRRLAPDARQVRDADRHRSQRDQEKSHALPLGQADEQKRIGQTDHYQHAPGRAIEKNRGQEEQKHRAELVRKTVESVGLERQRHKRGEQVEAE